MDCPQCGLVNPPEALRCDCGYDFRLRRQGGGAPGRSLTSGEVMAWLSLIFCVPYVGPLVGLSFAVYQFAKGKRDTGALLAASIFILAFHVVLYFFVTLSPPS